MEDNMNIMKKFLITCMACAIAVGLEAADTKQDVPVRSSLSYGSIGVGPLPIPLPVFGIGHREQYGHHGFDVNVQATTVVSATLVKGKLFYNYYFNPNLKSQFYTGIGVGVGGIFCNGFHPLASPEFVIGKQYKTDAGNTSFFQMEVSFPTFSRHNFPNHSCKFPMVVFSYGLCF
jgi:hypothetical protein